MTPCFVEHFSKLPDPRIERNKLHELMDIIVLTVCAVISGAEGWEDISDFGLNVTFQSRCQQQLAKTRVLH